MFCTNDLRLLRIYRVLGFAVSATYRRQEKAANTGSIPVSATKSFGFSNLRNTCTRFALQSGPKKRGQGWNPTWIRQRDSPSCVAPKLNCVRTSVRLKTSRPAAAPEGQLEFTKGEAALREVPPTLDLLSAIWSWNSLPNQPNRFRSLSLPSTCRF
jgi:hypothetical protein